MSKASKVVLTIDGIDICDSSRSKDTSSSSSSPSSSSSAAKKPTEYKTVSYDNAIVGQEYYVNEGKLYSKGTLKKKDITTDSKQGSVITYKLNDVDFADVRGIQNDYESGLIFVEKSDETGGGRKKRKTRNKKRSKRKKSVRSKL